MPSSVLEISRMNDTVVAADSYRLEGDTSVDRFPTHNESTLGYTRSTVNAVFDATSEERAKKTAGGNALELYGLKV